ncbi:MAG TPA: hypothetical protein VF092_13595 [Longimicrobium sp.]
MKKKLKERPRKLVVKHGPEVAMTLVAGFMSGVAASRGARR